MSQKIYIYKVLTKESRKDGRPNKYNDVYHPKAAYEIMSLGATKRKCAAILGIHHDTLYEWSRTYPEFSDSIKRGMDKFNGDLMELALNKKATGFTFKEKTYEKPAIPALIVAKGQGKREIIATIKAYMDAEGPILTKEVVKYYPPDVAAIKYYLGNREPERWPKNGDLPGEGQFIFYTKADVDQMLADEKKTFDRVPPPTKPKKEITNAQTKREGKGKNKKTTRGRAGSTHRSRAGSGKKV
jgi:hypothetical protein